MMVTTKREEITRLWPDLSFHYGLSFNELVLMPAWAIQIYAEELPRLIAGQQMRAIEAASYAHMDEGGQENILRRWREFLPESEGVKVQSLEQLQLLTAASGIGLVIEDA